MTSQGYKQQLGDRIRRARREADLTQRELADKLGLNQGQISTIESGQAKLAATDLPRWAQVLNKPVMYFFDEKGLSHQEQAAFILEMFSESQLVFVLDMLKNMAQNWPDDLPDKS